MFSYETRPAHFLIPTVILIVGGIFTHVQSWENVGYMIWGVAGLCVLWLIYSSIKEQELRKIQEEHYHYAEIMSLDAAKTMTRVIATKETLDDGYFSQSNAEVSIAPAKLKLFAEGVLGGRKMTIREWTPLKNGRLFSDGEWRRLIVFMKKPFLHDPTIHFIVQINPTDERLGFDLTTEGRKWLEDVINVHALTPI